MANTTISLRLPNDLIKLLPTSDKRRPPSRTDFIVSAIREKIARDDRFKLPMTTVADRSGSPDNS